VGADTRDVAAPTASIPLVPDASAKAPGDPARGARTRAATVATSPKRTGRRAVNDRRRIEVRLTAEVACAG